MPAHPDLDRPALHARYQQAAPTPFLSWTWVGCLAADRFPDPVLIETPGTTALFNRRGRTLFLHESGDPALDAIFTEHNGALGPLAPALAAAAPLARRIVLSGLDDTGLAAVQGLGGLVTGLQTRAAPFAALDPATPHIDRVSRNTRAQLRRSDRSYAAAGPITVERAETVDQALDWLAAMLPLHRATWAARGVHSAFLAEPVQRFHRTLIARGVPDGTVDLLRIAAGPRLIGYLFNLRGRTATHAYQSGFDYAGAAPHEKPGLTCHHAAIEAARARGVPEYDFLAGDSRYKRSLATASRDLHWLTWTPRPLPFERTVRRLVGR